MDAARQLAVGLVRADHADDRDRARVREQAGHVRDAADVLGPVDRVEAEVAVQPVAQVVPVEPVGALAVPREPLLERRRDRRLAGGGQAGQPHGGPTLAEQRPPRAASHATRVPPDVGLLRIGPLQVCLDDHACSDCAVGRLIDHDEAAGGPVAPILVEDQRHAGPQPHATDVVEPELARVLVPVQRVDVDAVADLIDHGPRRARRVLDRVHAARHHGLVGHPADDRLDVPLDRRAVVRPADHVPARDVEIVHEPQSDRHRRARVAQWSVEGLDRRDARLIARRQHDDGIAGTEHAGGDLTGVRAVLAGAVGGVGGVLSSTSPAPGQTGGSGWVRSRLEFGAVPEFGPVRITH